MLEEIQTMWAGHLGRINVSQHPIELERVINIQSIRHNILQDSKQRTFENKKLCGCLSKKVIIPAQTKGAARIFFRPDQNRVTSLLRRLSKFERSNSHRHVSNIAYGLVY